jgi:hypothetical protein
MMASESLIKKDNQQLALFGSDQMDAALFASEESEPQRLFTGARLFASDPERYKAIIALSAEGLGAIRIGRILQVSPHTVLAVREREPEAVAIEKNRIANLSRGAARMCVEGIIDLLADPDQKKKISAKDLSIIFGILTEKFELLSGSPTARVLNVTATVDYDDYVRGQIAAYERKQIGLGGEKEGTKAPAAALEPDGKGSVDEDVGHGAIVDPGASCEVRRPIALLEEHKEPSGILTHRYADMPVNIDRNEGGQIDGQAINKAESVTT